jgi:hypothetical protein
MADDTASSARSARRHGVEGCAHPAHLALADPGDPEQGFPGASATPTLA